MYECFLYIRLIKENFEMLSFSSIAMIGNFNPAIFHPAWFERYKILPIQEIQWAEGLKIERDEVDFRGRKLMIQSSPTPPLIVTPGYSSLNFQSMRVEVSQERFECKTLDRGKFSLVKEVSLKIFSLLGHTPVIGVGINFEGHWRFKNDAFTILKNLFVKSNETFEDIFGQSYNVTGRVISKEDGCQLGIELLNSSIFKDAIYFNANFHRDIISKRAEDALKIISECYDNDLNTIIEKIKKLLGSPQETYKNHE